MTSPRTVVIAGAGIGGLTAALALAQRGFRVIGHRAGRTAGGDRRRHPAFAQCVAHADRPRPRRAARAHVVAPEALNVMNARTGRVLARAPLGDDAAKRYGAPYWVIHRGDLQAVLREAVDGDAADRRCSSAARRGFRSPRQRRHRRRHATDGSRSRRTAAALIGADGLWSALRERLGHRDAAALRAPHRLARAGSGRRGVAGAARARGQSLARPRTPISSTTRSAAAASINVVAILRDDWRETGWSAPGERDEMLARFPAGMWHAAPRELIAAADQLAEMGALRLPPAQALGHGPGDAARRRRASDAALSRAGRRDGDRGRRGAGAMPGADARRRAGGAAQLREQAPASAPRARSAPPAATAPSITWAAPRRSCARWRWSRCAAPACCGTTTGSIAGSRSEPRAYDLAYRAASDSSRWITTSHSDGESRRRRPARSIRSAA